MAWLTWQAIRALADTEVAKTGDVARFKAPVSRGAVVYVRDAWRAPWRTTLAPLASDCVLVTAFSDAHVERHATAELLDGSAVRHWFAVQVNTTHPRLTAMPIGIDGRDIWALRSAPSLPWRDRDIGCLANFQPRNAERRALTKWCRSQPWMVTDDWHGQMRPRSMADYYARLGRSRFVLSPPGRGWDCYRTYEALAMGAVPVVRRQRPISDVVNGLPVLVVDDWSELTPERLQRPAGELTRMTLAYWRERILNVAHK
jgi:hypothetical protein